MKNKFYFVYGIKSRNQLSRMFLYRRCALNLLRRLDSPGQYAIGWAKVRDIGVISIGPGQIKINDALWHKDCM